MIGKLYMLPCPIAEHQINTLPESTVSVIHKTQYYIAERARTCRRFIKETQPPYTIDSLTIEEMDKNNPGIHIPLIISWLKEGKDVGVVSESGCPGIADPGALYCAAAQKNDIDVIPLVGPSSILLALMGAGMNGQNFCFVGYLPIKTPELKSKLHQLEKAILQQGQTQIFIETPYRNDKLFTTLVETLSAHIKLCVASEISGPEASIKTKTIAEWKVKPYTIGKKNTIFVLGK